MPGRKGGVRSRGLTVMFAQRRHRSPLNWHQAWGEDYVAVHILDPAETTERVTIMPEDITGFTDASATWG